MNKLTPEDIEWKLVRSYSFNSEAFTVFRDNRFSIQQEQIVKTDGNGWTGSMKKYFYMDSIEKPFKTEQELCEAWNERNDFDDPNNEIVWVKKIVPIRKMNAESIQRFQVRKR